MSDEPGLRARIEDRVRASTMRELVRLRHRTSAVEEAVAENRPLRLDLERVLAQVETDVRSIAERGLAHGATRRTGR